MNYYYCTRTMPNGTPWKYTFLSDFDIADHFGKGAVRDTYKRVMREWKTDIKAMAELYIALNMRLWFWYQTGHEDLAKLYDELFFKTKNFVYSPRAKFTKEDLDYFFEMTD